LSDKPGRLRLSSRQREFSPTLRSAPPLPAIDWSQVGIAPPELLPIGPEKGLPAADAIVLTWADAEWAAMQQVFCSSGQPMPYADRNRGKWSGWTQYAEGMLHSATHSTRDWSYWGEWRLVEIRGKRVLLFKSNTHLDFPGEAQLVAMVERLIRQARPSLLLSIGTAGGAMVGDHLGTVRAVSAGTLYEADTPRENWPVYSNAWSATDSPLSKAGLASLLYPIPTTEADLQALCNQFNTFHGTRYSIFDLDPNGLNSGDTLPKVVNSTGGALSLLTTPVFVVGTTAGDYSQYACIEMDDALVGKVCAAEGVDFGFVRNISDPVQNAELPDEVQGSWGSTVYDAYGIYTSFNGALTAWAMLADWA